MVIQNLEMAGVILSISWLSQEIFGKGTESNNLLRCIEVTNKLDDSVLTPVVNHGGCKQDTTENLDFPALLFLRFHSTVGRNGSSNKFKRESDLYAMKLVSQTEISGVGVVGRKSSFCKPSTVLYWD